jgi:phasin family protein
MAGTSPPKKPGSPSAKPATIKRETKPAAQPTKAVPLAPAAKEAAPAKAEAISKPAAVAPKPAEAKATVAKAEPVLRETAAKPVAPASPPATPVAPVAAKPIAPPEPMAAPAAPPKTAVAPLATAKPAEAPAPAPEPAKAPAVAAKTEMTIAPQPVLAPIPPVEPFMKGLLTMATPASVPAADKVQAMFGDFNERAKTAFEKSAKFGEEMTDFTKGNVEAIVASARVAAKGAESLTQEAAEYGKKSFETASATMKSFASVKSPTELFQLQSDYAKSTFDSAVAEASKLSEAWVKLATDVFQPISSRYAVAAEKIKSAAL